ncbi:MAG: hypothetical protein AMJ79_05690 [Phycisphaerae bacterium SM23_30]|nr:MAG: hypothetical protein AMJ79_05690 [Phycisphaerae bacterium SM23_30]
MQAETVHVDKLSEHVGEEVVLKGWLYNSRSSGKVQFLIFRDGTGLCQAVLEKTDDKVNLFNEVKHLGQESSLCVQGIVRQDERSVGGYELAVTDVQIVHKTEGYPITLKHHGPDFLMKHRHLHLRSQRQWAIARVRHTVVEAIRKYLNENDYILVDTPIFSPAAGEDKQSLFNVDYFGEEVALAQTGQLHVEAGCLSLGKVYCFGPTFRAEKSKTRRHLTEFWMVEPEVAYLDMEGLVELAEEFTCAIVEHTLKHRRAELELLGRDLSDLKKVQRPFYQLRYSEVIDLLHSQKIKDHLEAKLEVRRKQLAELEKNIEEWTAQQESVKKQWQKEKLAQQILEARDEAGDLREQIENIPYHMELAAAFEWGKDLGGSDETIISELHDKPVCVTHYPKEVKAFYMRLDRDDPRVVENLDVLASQGYGEIIGGSMREEDFDILLNRIKEFGLDPAAYEWYLDLRRYGSVPHGGFGLGVERTVAWITGIKHIRETIAYPRMMGKLYP